MYNGDVTLDEEVDFSADALARVGVSRVYSPLYGNIAYIKEHQDRQYVPIMRHHDTWIARLTLAIERGMNHQAQIELLPLQAEQHSRLWRPARERSEHQVMLG